MKKCPFFTVLLLILIFVMPISIGAENQSVYDWSGLLSASEEAKIEEMAQKQGVTEQLKSEQPMEWIGLMNNIQACAREIVSNEIIFA